MQYKDAFPVSLQVVVTVDSAGSVASAIKRLRIAAKRMATENAQDARAVATGRGVFSAAASRVNACVTSFEKALGFGVSARIEDALTLEAAKAKVRRQATRASCSLRARDTVLFPAARSKPSQMRHMQPRVPLALRCPGTISRRTRGPSLPRVRLVRGSSAARPTSNGCARRASSRTTARSTSPRTPTTSTLPPKTAAPRSSRA